MCYHRCTCVRNDLLSVAINGAKVAVSENINKFGLNLLLTLLVQTYRHRDGPIVTIDPRFGMTQGEDYKRV
jgi:hypothetical protein